MGPLLRTLEKPWFSFPVSLYHAPVARLQAARQHDAAKEEAGPAANFRSLFHGFPNYGLCKVSWGSTCRATTWKLKVSSGVC